MISDKLNQSLNFVRMWYLYGRLLSTNYFMCFRIYRPKASPHQERVNPMLTLNHSSDEECYCCFHLKDLVFQK